MSRTPFERKKAGNDDRFLRLGYRTHSRLAECHRHSRRKSESSERTVRRESADFRQDEATLGQRHRSDYDDCAVAHLEHLACTGLTHSGNTGNRSATARQKRHDSVGNRRTDCSATQVGHRIRLRARRRFRGYDAAGMRICHPSRTARSRRAYADIQCVFFGMGSGRRGNAINRRPVSRFGGCAVGVVVFAGDLRILRPYESGHTHCAPHSGRAVAGRYRQAHARPSARQKPRATQ